MEFPAWPARRNLSMTEPTSRPSTRPAPVQPWAVGLVGVMLILMLLVGLTF
jgi:hypothetical protein